MPAIWAAGISAGAGILGNFMSQSGQQATNAMQMQMMLQNEQWQEKMSDTQMQRRVTDLKAAGLNPMLAVGTPGAAMPSFQQPNLQNPSAAFGNMGQQVSSAMQTATVKAQIDNLNADTAYKSGPQSKLTGEQAGLTAIQAKVQQTTNDVLIPAQAAAQRAAATLDDSSRQRIQQQIQSGDIAAQIRLLGSQTTLAGAQAALARVDARMDTMSAIEKQYSMPFIIQQLGVQLQQMKLSIPEMNAAANYYETWAGKHLFLQQQIQGGINTAAGVISALKPGLGGGGMPGVNSTPGFTMGAGAPRWPNQ